MSTLFFLSKDNIQLHNCFYSLLIHIVNFYEILKLHNNVHQHFMFATFLHQKVYHVVISNSKVEPNDLYHMDKHPMVIMH